MTSPGEPEEPYGDTEPAADVLPESPPPAPRRMSPLERVVAVLALLVGGLALGVVGAFVQADRLVVGSIALPWGTAIVLVALVVCVRGGAWWVMTRWGGAAVAVGWLVATVALATTSPSGDLAISAGGRQMVYLFGGVVLATAAVTVPLVERRPTAEVRVRS